MPADFFITLPSNTRDHPENTSSSFRTRLPETIKLKTDKWKCGLAEIVYTNSFENVTDQLAFACTNRASGERTSFHLNHGNYPDHLSLLNALWSASTVRRKRDAAAAAAHERLPENPTPEQMSAYIAKYGAREATAEEIEALLERRKKARLQAEAASAASTTPAPPQPEPSATPFAPPPTPSSTPAPDASATTTPLNPAPDHDRASETRDTHLQELGNLLKTLQQDQTIAFKETISALLKSVQQDQTSSYTEAIGALINTLQQDQTRALRETIDTLLKTLQQDQANALRETLGTLLGTLRQDQNSALQETLGAFSSAHASSSQAMLEETRRVHSLLQETMAVQRSTAADSKRIANSGNVRSYSLGRAQDQYARHGFSFDYDPLLQRMVVAVNRNMLSAITLSPQLAYICGYSIPRQNENESVELVQAKNVAPYKVDFYNNISTMFIYTDCIQPRIVGDGRSQLLRVIPVQNDRPNAVISTTFNPVQYFPINIENLDCIQIKLCDEFGKSIKFHFGTTICILHFVKIA